MRKSQTLNKLFTSLFLTLYIFASPALAIESVLNTEPVQQEEETPVDTSEDILDEGISTSIYDGWVENADGSYTTAEAIVLNETYVYPNNTGVTIKFTKLPVVSDTVTIRTLSLTAQEKLELGTTEDVAYEFVTGMVDGSFKYVMTLPASGDNSEVVYAENRIGLSDGEVIDGLKTNDLVTITGDHFTVFVVVETSNVFSDGVTEVNETCSAEVIGSDTYCYDTIQEAVTAATAGDTIQIGNGTHILSSQLVIDKDLIITGEDEASTILIPGFNTSGSGDARGLILIKSDADLTLSKVTIDGTGFNVYQTLRANDAGNLALSEMTLKNLSYPGYQGVGIALISTILDLNNVTMQNIGREGILVFGTSVANINDLTYTGKGNGDWLDYGVEVGGGGSATIQNSYIGNCLGVASSDGSTSAGFLATTYFGAGSNADISNIKFVNNSTAIAVGYDSDDTSDITVEYSDLSSNTYGVTTTGVQVDATNNKWGTSKESEIQNLIYGDVTYNPWYGKAVNSVLTVNEYLGTDGVYYVKGTDTLDFTLAASPVYYQKYIAGLWGYNEATGSRNDLRYIGWNSLYPDLLDTIMATESWDLETTGWMGSNPPGTVIPEGDYILWAERNYTEDGYVRGSTTTERVSVDNTQPTISEPRMLVSRDGGTTFQTSDRIKYGDIVKIQAEADDTMSGIGRVEFRIQDKDTGEYVAPRVFVDTPVYGNTYEYIFEIPSDERYVNTHGPISTDESQLRFWVRSYDNVGNYAHGDSGLFTYDKVAPFAPTGLTILDEQGNVLGCEGYTNNRRITVNWDNNSEEDFDHYIYGIKNNEYFKNLISSEYTGNIKDIDGYYKYIVRAVDTAGNISEPTEWCGVTLDREDPSGTFAGILGNAMDLELNDTTPIIFGAYSDDNGVSEITLEVDGKTYSPVFTGGDWTSPELEDLTEGIYTATLRVTDVAGNVIAANQDIEIDTSAPETPASLGFSTKEDPNTIITQSGAWTNTHFGAKLYWTESTENDFEKYEYISYNPDGSTGPIREFTDNFFDATWWTGAKEGTSAFQVRSVDQLGNTSEWSTRFEINRDFSDPTGTIDSAELIMTKNGDIYNNTTWVLGDNSPTIKGTYNDSLSGIKSITAKIAGVQYPTTYSNNNWRTEIVPDLLDGIYTLQITIEDNVGYTTVLTKEITLDGTAPTAVYTQYKNGVEIMNPIAYAQNLNELSFTAEYSDNLSGLYWDSFAIFEAQDDGSFRFSANGKKSYGGWRKNPNLVHLSGGLVETLILPVNYSVITETLPDGEYYMAHQVYDNAVREDIPTINQFRDVLGLHFVIDNLSPTSEFDEDLSGMYTKEAITIKGRSTDNNNVASVNIYYRQTGSENWILITNIPNLTNSTAFDWEYTWTPAEDGTYDIKASAYDIAGNHEQSPIITAITYDTSAPNKPTGMIITNEDKEIGDGGYTNTREIKLDWDDNTDPDLAYYLFDIKDKDGHKTLTISEYEATIRDEDGDYQYKVRAVDLAGNISEASDWYHITLDREKPVIANPLGDMTLLEGDPFPTDTVSLTDNEALDKVFVKATDLTNGLGSETGSQNVSAMIGDQFPIADEIRKAIEDWQETAFPTVDLNVLPEGRYEISYYATDMAGNASDPQSFIVTIENNIPEVSITPSATEVTVGQPLVLSASIARGNADFTYAWSGDCTGTESTAIADTTTAGNYTCTVTVTDEDGDSDSETFAYSVGEVAGATTQALGTGGGFYYAETTDTTDEQTGDDENGDTSGDTSKEVKGAEDTTLDDTTDEKTNSTWWIYLIIALVLLTIFFLILKRRKEEENN
jgi:hypothetical protein